MGQSIERTSYSARDFKAFSARLHQNLRALREILREPTFGRVPDTLGAELEFYIVDADGVPLAKNTEIRERARDPGLTLELNRYNLEYNYQVHAFGGDPFLALERDIQASQDRLNELAAKEGGRVLAIGILPTLTEAFLGTAWMTAERRYQVLSDVLIAMRGGAFDLDIRGEEQLKITRDDITAEGICTSFQVHYGCDIADFVDIWNALALVTPLALAISANSPLLFGRRLWHESRVPLFKQATDSRREGTPWHDLARVDITRDWLRKSPYELFAQRVYLYPPLIPHCGAEDPLATWRNGRLPSLYELNLHNGTVWHWNRPIYCNEGSGHIRIELRSLPAGPSAVDMVANAAFHIGLAVGLKERIDLLIPAMPFRFVARNFMAAAKEGIEARLIWPSLNQNRLRDKPARVLGESLLETARQGLARLGVERAEVERFMGVVEKRLENGQNGAIWQLQNHRRLVETLAPEQALIRLVQGYMENSLANRPVAEWEPLA